MDLKRCTLALLALLITLPARAQFAGYVSPQTEVQTLATNATCTGSAQVFAINNLGQTQHWLTVGNITGASKFQAEIVGIDSQNTVYRISDVMEIAGILSVRQGALYGSGSYPKFQALITCSPNTATFTASYQGGWGTFNFAGGTYLTTQLDKMDFNNASATALQSDNFQTPFGSSAGSLIFVQNSGSVGASQVQIQCNTNGQLQLNTVFLVTLPGNGPITYQVPAASCPYATVIFNPLGGPSGTFSLEYVFTPPGLAAAASTDPCQSGAFTKVGTPVNAVAGGATTQIVPIVGNSSIYVCGYILSQLATAATVQWVYGTGSNCGTGTTILTGAMGVTASQPEAYAGPGYIFKVPASNALCLTVAGTGSVSGVVTAVQSP